MNYYLNYPKYFPMIEFKELTFAYLCKVFNSLEEARSQIGKAEEILHFFLVEDHSRMKALRVFRNYAMICNNFSLLHDGRRP